MKLYPAWFLGLVLVSACTRTQLAPDFRGDYGPTVYQTNRPITGEFVSMPLGHSGFRAVVSAMRYTDKADKNPDFCFISVEHGDPAKGNGGTVCFQRQFPASIIPAPVLNAKAEDIVSFDASHREVTFKLGPTNYSYTLPKTK
jgi:hypothetical protein